MEHGADIDALVSVRTGSAHAYTLFAQDGGGNTPHDLAGLYGHHECTRLLRALHWACRKDATARGKIETQVLDRRRLRESTALTTRLQREAASDAYTRWMRNKNLPTNVRHKSDSKCKEARTQACGACSALTSQRFGPYNETLTTPIKISHRQEERNIQGVGKPEKLFPYSNYPPRPAVPQRKKPCVAPRSQSAAPNGRTPQRIPHPHSAPPLRTHSSAAAAATSAMEPCPEVEEVSSRDNQVEEEGEDDDDALFHEVDQMGEFRSSTLPRFINGKQLTQLLQLLSSRTITGTRSTNSLPLSQDRANTRHAKYRSQFHRRFSLGAIPEGQVVESYIKYGAVTCCDTEEESCDVWEAAQGSNDGCEKSIDSDGELNNVVGYPQECDSYVPATSGDCNDRSSPQKPSPLSLAIVNFTWDRDRNSVCTEAVSSPLVPHPFPEHQQVRNSGRKTTSRRPSTSTSLRTVSRRVSVPKSAPPNRTALNREPPSVLSLGGLASKSMLISDHVSDAQASQVTPNAKCVKPAMFVFGGSLVHT